MRLFLTKLLFSILLLLRIAFAGETYVGQGSYVGHKSDGECEEVGITIENNETEFKILEGSYHCGILKAQYPSSTFIKRNGFLFYNDIEVGYYFDGLIYIAYGSGTYELLLEKTSDNKLYFLERWEDETSFLTIKAQLLKRD